MDRIEFNFLVQLKKLYLVQVGILRQQKLFKRMGTCDIEAVEKKENVEISEIERRG